MQQERPAVTRAVALDRFGGLETLGVRTIPVPRLGPGEILIRVESAGVGVWDVFEREGGFAEMMGIPPRFPYVLGSDGAGTVVAVGDRVDRFRVGERVHGYSLFNPKGGFYSEYTVIKADDAAPIPANLDPLQAGAMPVCAMTALRGLDDTLRVAPGEGVLIFGASGGVGHLAVQLARRMGAWVLAVASGEDGVELCRRLGADAVVEGHRPDLGSAIRAAATHPVSAALFTAGGEAGKVVLGSLPPGTRVAYPNGVELEGAPAGSQPQSYDGMPDPEAIARLNALIEAGPFEVHVARVFTLEQAAEAHQALEQHYLGKLVLRPSPV